jgi:predicted GNAT family acetyltransferase
VTAKHGLVAYIVLVIVTHHPNGSALLFHAGSFLLSAEAENGLLLGICGAPPAEPAMASSDLWMTVDSTAGPVAVALHTPPFNLALSRAPDDALDALAHDLGQRVPSLPGVSGPGDVAQAFANRWVSAQGGRAEVQQRQGIYEVSRVIPPSPCAPGALRVADSADVTVITEWIGGFASDAKLPASNRERLPDRARSLVDAGRAFLWEVAGEPVSMAALQGPTPNGIRVSMVYTPPALRRRGYAAACVAAVSRHALASGRRFCTLYTDLANPTSNGIYRRVGYRFICESTMIGFVREG